MNGKQRILIALDGGQPDRVPICDWIDEPTLWNLADFLGFSVEDATPERTVLSGEESLRSLDLLCLLMRELDICGTCYPYSTELTRLDDKYARDKYDRVFVMSEHGMPIIADGPIKEPADTRGYDMASKVQVDDLENVQYLIERLGPDRMVVLDMKDPFAEGWLLRGGMENYLLDFYRRPGLVHELGRITTDYMKAVIDLAAGIGVEAIAMCGDLAGEKKMLISPAHYREFVRPYQEELVDFSHERGIRVIKHSDGNVWPVLDDFVEIGFDGFNPVQPQSMDIGDVKECLVGQVCIMGNIDCRDLLPGGTPQEVMTAVRETIAVAGPGGGYILASSNSLHPDCRPKNIVAMVKATHEYGVYPLASS